jgi:hypothetical protein
VHRDRCSPRLPGAAGQAPDHGASARRRIGSASHRSRRTRPSPARRGFCAMRTPNVAFRSALMAAFVSLGVIKPDGTARTVRRDPTWDRAAVRTQLKAPRQGRVWELSTTRSPCAGRNATRPRQGSSLGVEYYQIAMRRKERDPPTTGSSSRGLGAAPRAGSIPPWETTGHEQAPAPQGDDSVGRESCCARIPVARRFLASCTWPLRPWKRPAIECRLVAACKRSSHNALLGKEDLERGSRSTRRR